MFENTIPILAVRDLAASLDYYLRVLGFTLDFHVEGIIAGVSRDRGHVMLAEGDQGQPGTWVWFGVDDVEPLYEEFLGRGAKVRLPPTNYLWAYELQLEDPDGHVLRFAAEPKDGHPVGERLDMHGRRWAMNPDGSWRPA